MSSNKPIRSTIKVCDKVLYKDKEYVVVDIDFLCGGNVMEVSMVRISTYFNWGIRRVISLYDGDIESLEIKKESEE